MKINELIDFDSAFKLVKIVSTKPSLPVRGSNVPPKQVEKLDNKFGFDQFGNKYTYFENNNYLEICVNNFNISLKSELEKLSNKVAQIIITVNDQKEFNTLCKMLFNAKINNPIIISLGCIEMDKNTWMDFEYLPDNVYVSNSWFDSETGKEIEYKVCSKDFDHWCLWLNDRDFNLVNSKLTPYTKERIEGQHMIAERFFKIYMNKYYRLGTDQEKVNFAYNWIKNNIIYDFDSINRDGTLKCHEAQDPVYTLINGKGVCAGRARLLKTILNNRYMRVECYLTTGMHGRLPHEWNEIYVDNQKKYYDFSYGLNGVTSITESRTGYYNIQSEDIIKRILKKQKR